MAMSSTYAGLRHFFLAGLASPESHRRREGGEEAIVAVKGVTVVEAVVLESPARDMLAMRDTDEACRLF